MWKNYSRIMMIEYHPQLVGELLLGAFFCQNDIRAELLLEVYRTEVWQR